MSNNKLIVKGNTRLKCAFVGSGLAVLMASALFGPLAYHVERDLREARRTKAGLVQIEQERGKDATYWLAKDISLNPDSSCGERIGTDLYMEANPISYRFRDWRLRSREENTHYPKFYFDSIEQHLE